jgi:hypothetical protein
MRGSTYRPRVLEKAVCPQLLGSLLADGCREFPTVTPHDLRQSAASSDANVKAVQRMLGHAKASMTLDVYADLFDDELDIVGDASTRRSDPPRSKHGPKPEGEEAPDRIRCGLGPRGDGQQTL